MHRSIRFAVAAFTALFVAACADSPTSAPASATPVAGKITKVIEPGTCTDLATLLDQAATIFGAGSPNFNSVRGKLENLQQQIDLGNTTETKGKAHNIVNFVLDKSGEGGLPGTDEQIEEFANGVYCFAGLDIVLTDLDNSHLIFPADAPQVVYSADQQSGISLPAFPVNAPTLITFGTGAPLDTKLDQYPGFITITAQADAETILTQPVTVGVCAQGAIPQAVRDRLRLGHGASSGFELTPPAPADFLTCDNEVASAPPAPLWHKLAASLLPARLEASSASAIFSGGGVGGTVIEFSPFGPVDPELSFSGGVGGTVIEFVTTGAESGISAALNESCEPIEAPVGTPVASACLPNVRVHTRLGTNFENVPVTWAVTEGGGQIAPRTQVVCGTYGSGFAGVTSPAGRSGICWTLGAEGLNRVTAVPSLGGDAIPGVVFSTGLLTFDAIANPPVGLVFTEVPTSVVAGVPFDVRVIEVDKYGQRVLGASSPVTVALNQFSFAGGGTSSTVNAVAGEAVFSGLVITKAASGYSFSASAPYLQPPMVLPSSDSFSITAAAPATLSMVQGDGQTAPAGSVTPIAPTVRLVDMYGNAVGGVTIGWTAGGSSTGSVSPLISSTDASGQAATTWTLGDGMNQLLAEVPAYPAIAPVRFEANGTSTLGVLNYCAPGGSGDPVNDPSKPYAFFLPDPGNNKTIRQIQLHFSSTGRANNPTPYVVELTTQRGTFDPAASAPVSTVSTVVLKGNNSEWKTVTFNLSQPIVGASGQNAKQVMVRLRVLSNPDATTLTFNTGPCSPGKSCKVPVGCAATEVSSPLPYPLGTTYRKSVGVTVKGS